MIQRAQSRFITGFLFLVFSCSIYAAEVNKPASLIDTQLLNGKVLKASELRGKVVLLTFWATWCPTCRKELPELQKSYEFYHKDGLEIVALSIDDSDKEVKAFWAGKGYEFPVAMSTKTYIDAYGKIKGTPTAYLIDRKGVIRKKYVGEFTDSFEKDFRKLL